MADAQANMPLHLLAAQHQKALSILTPATDVAACILTDQTRQFSFPIPVALFCCSVLLLVLCCCAIRALSRLEHAVATSAAPELIVVACEVKVACHRGLHLFRTYGR